MAKVLYFSKDYTPHDHRFLSALSGTEHRVYYLRLERGPRQTEDRPVPANIEEILWKGGRKKARRADYPGLFLDLQRILHRLRPDLIHVGPIQTCGLLAALTGFRPQLVMSWGFDLMQDAWRSPAWRWATAHTLRRATMFTSDCEATREAAVSFGMARERTVVFPWGVDLIHFAPSQESRAEGAPFTLFCNRSWEPRYGVDVLARAFVPAAHEHPDMRLMLLGGGSQAKTIREILEKGGVLEQVTLAGQIPQSDLPRYYHMADLFISPSHIDGSSVSLMEALACGLPCLVSDIPANLEWVKNDQNGWVFRDGDSDELTQRIEKAYHQRHALAGIGAAARRTAEEKADWNRNFHKLMEAYDRTLQWKP